MRAGVVDIDNFTYAGGNKWRLKCFYCGETFGDWVAKDDPWVKHAQLVNVCPFVVQQKGIEFVRNVQNNVAEPTDSDKENIVNVS